MERWLTKSRVLLGLCGVLLIAAFNRHDPMVFGMFLMLAVVSMLGFLVPWLSLRTMSIQFAGEFDQEVQEGEACDMGLLVRRTAPWPAFMVDIEAEWEWASRRLILKQTVPVIHAKQAPALGQMVRFPCRGHYELVAVRMSSGFPLGLMRAQHSLSRPDIQVRVLPLAHNVQWPLPWDVADDPLGELTTRRVGQSFELGMLRPYQHGESVGRVSWGASARAGELVIQHFQQSGTIRLRLVMDLPREPVLGDAESPGENVVRVATGVGDTALAHGAQLFLYLSPEAMKVHDGVALRHALAEAVPSVSLQTTLSQLAQEVAPGEQVAVVVACDYPAAQLLAHLHPIAARGCHAVVCIAPGRSPSGIQMPQAVALQKVMTEAGFATVLESTWR